MQAPVFSREQVIEETVEVFTANPSLAAEQAQSLSGQGQIKLDAEGVTLVNVEQAGVYRIFARVMSPDTELAQSACNVSLNGQVLTTVQTNGTEGNWIQLKLVKAELEAGLYELKIEHTKPGMQIEGFEFKLV
jgi:beta-glucosidase